jgi:pimeloyl-ACP methyl ester carboxylesterase
VASGDQAIRCGGVEMEATVTVPTDARGTVIFAHGSGSGRYSPRNQFVAAALNDANLATVLADLLTAEEEQGEQRGGRLRFDIGLLAERVTAIVDWTEQPAVLLPSRRGLFGASTGAAAALFTAANRPEKIRAVVSRGGRPDLAADALPRVKAPTLLIVGGADETVLELNHQAFDVLQCEKRLEVVPGATHLFEEPGALERVAELAAAWFTTHLSADR